RQESRAQLRRRRRLAALGLALALIAVVAAIVLAGRASSPTHGQGPVAHASAHRIRDRRVEHDTARARNGPPGTGHVPILMYHVINPPPAGVPFPGLYVSPGEFAAQMQALAAAGYHAVTMDQMLAYWRHGTPLPPGKPVVLSFDNGYQSQYTQALPVLRALGWVGDENVQLTGLPPSQGGLGQQEIRGLIAAGWELDTQGFSHADLITLSASSLHYEVAVSRQELRRRFGVPVNWFCYPSGHYDASVVAEVAAAGYAGSTTVVPGWAHPRDDPYRLHRLRVLGGTSGPALLSLLAATRSNPAAPSSYSG
ncbi:MAG TPA: polysaccharide deacetylase family protein, partial [Solirubrobacteraceae bacterium]